MIAGTGAEHGLNKYKCHKNHTHRTSRKHTHTQYTHTSMQNVDIYALMAKRAFANLKICIGSLYHQKTAMHKQSFGTQEESSVININQQNIRFCVYKQQRWSDNSGKRVSGATRNFKINIINRRNIKINTYYILVLQISWANSLPMLYLLSVV